MKYNVVVLSNLWDSMEEGITKEMLHSLFLTKKLGYSSVHDKDMLPIGIEDFIGDHVLICKGDDPVCIFKIITSDTLQRYSLKHPLLEMMKDRVTPEFYKSTEKEIELIHKQNLKTSYSGGFTLNKALIESKEEVQTLKDIYCALHYLIHKDRGIDTLYGYSLPLVKTNELFSSWGIHPIDFGEGGHLFKLSGYGEVEVMPIKAKVDELSFLTKKHAKKYKDLWESRIETSKVKVTEQVA